MITTNDERLAADLQLRDCGRTSRYVHDIFGFTARLNTANAAFGGCSCATLTDGTSGGGRSRGGTPKLRDVPEVILPPMGNRDITPVFHLFVVRAEDRDALARSLQSRDIETAVHYPVPIHLQRCAGRVRVLSGSYRKRAACRPRSLAAGIPHARRRGRRSRMRAIIDHYGGKI